MQTGKALGRGRGEVVAALLWAGVYGADVVMETAFDAAGDLLEEWELMRFTGVNHICIATRDLDRAVRTWSDRYGVGPGRLWTKDDANMSAEVDGKPTELRHARRPLRPCLGHPDRDHRAARRA